jgi:hypothetical protein
MDFLITSTFWVLCLHMMLDRGGHASHLRIADMDWGVSKRT